MREFIDIVTESVDLVLDGWWIDEHGDLHECEHRRSEHHADIAIRELDIDGSELDIDPDAEDADEESDNDFIRDFAIQEALTQGWVRCSIYGKVASLEWATTLTEPTKRTLLAWLREYAPAFTSVAVGAPGKEYQAFDDPVKLIRFVRQKIG